MNCWRIQNLLAPYLDGVLPEAEHDAFTNHLEDCPECERLTADVAALPSFEGLDVAGPDSEAILEALSQSIADRIAAAAPTIDEEGRALRHSQSGGTLLYFLRAGEVKVSGAAAAAYVAAVLLLAAGIGLNHQHVLGLEASIAERDAIIDGMSARIAASEPDYLPLLATSSPEKAGVVILPAGARGTGALVGSPLRSVRTVRWTQPNSGWAQPNQGGTGPGLAPYTVSLSSPDEGLRVVH
jgi:anti-sigma factor RsiW